MASIGKMAYLISADATALSTELDKAARNIQGFAASASKALTAPFKALQSVAGVGTSGLAGLMQPITSLLQSIPIVGGAFAAIPLSGAAFSAWIKQSLIDIRDIDKEARKLGVSTSSMSGLLLAFGGDSEAAVHGLLHLQRTLGEISMGNKEVSKSFRDFGIDAKALGQQGTEQALRTIMDRIHQLSNTEGAQLGFRALGKGAGEMMDVLRKGGGALDEAKAKADKLGLSFTALEASGAAKALKAIKAIEQALSGVGKQIAISIAPWIEKVANGFTSWIESAGGIRTVVVVAFNAVVDAIIAAVTAVDAFISELKQLKAESNLLKPWKWVTPSGIAQNATTLAAEMAGIDAAGPSGRVSGLIAGLEKMKRSPQLLQEVAQATNALSGAQLKLVSDTVDLEQALQKQVATFGMSENQMKLWELGQRGATAASLGLAEGLMIQVDALDKIKKVTEEVESPLQWFGKRFSELQGLLAHGLDPAIFVRGAAEAFKKLKSAMHLEPPAAASAIQAGSGGAEQADMLIRRQLSIVGNQGQGIQEQMLAIMQAQMQTEQQQAMDTAGILQWLAGFPGQLQVANFGGN